MQIPEPRPTALERGALPAVALLCLFGCSRAGRDSTPEGEAWAYEREFRANPAIPVSLTLRTG